MNLSNLLLLISLVQVASFYTSQHRSVSRGAVSQKFLFGNPEPPKNSPAKKDDKGGMFGGIERLHPWNL